MRYDLVIFDLDGTLLNTLDDLAWAANAALREAGFPERSTEEIRAFIGNGVARLIRRASPEGTGEQTLDHILSRFKALYMENINVRTQPFPSIVEMLDQLNAAGVQCAVNSNKVDEATRALCAIHFGPRIAMALGERPDIPRKPAPDGVYLLLETLGVAPGRALYVGDGDADLKTAKNAGIDGAWVSWGYRHREELDGLDIPRAFDDASSLLNYILS